MHGQICEKKVYVTLKFARCCLDYSNIFWCDRTDKSVISSMLRK